jgi:hypothetical protein
MTLEKLTVSRRNPVVFTFATLLAMVSTCVWCARMPVAPT